MLQKIPWKSGPAEPATAGIVSATRTEIHKFRDMPAIYLRGLRLRSHWPEMPGAVGVQLATEPSKRTTWTVSLWSTNKDLHQFVRSQRHIDTIGPYRNRMSVAGTTWDTDRFDLTDAWAEAQRRLAPEPQSHSPRRRGRRGLRTSRQAGAKLPWPSRFMALQYRFFKLVRHRQTPSAARRPADTGDFASLRGARQCLIVCFKQSGEPIATPVNLGLADGKAYFRSEPHVAKMTRLRNNPSVHICACNIRGKPTGPMLLGTARILPESDAIRAHEILRSNWDPPTKMMELFLDRINVPAVYIEVAPQVAVS